MVIALTQSCKVVVCNSCNAASVRSYRLRPILSLVASGPDLG